MDNKILVHSANSPDVCHWGINGQQWGKRRYQNEDGSLTPLGRIHYGVGEAKERSKIKIREMKAETKSAVKLAKAQAKAAKAVANAEKEKIAAKTKEYRDRKEADNIVELEKIKAQREADRMDAKNEAQLNKNLAEANKENAEAEKSSSRAVKTVLGIVAAAGVGYLLYRAASHGEASASTREAAEEAIKKISDKPVSEVTSKASEITTKTSMITPKAGAIAKAGNSDKNLVNLTLGKVSKSQQAEKAGKQFGNAALERLEKYKSNVNAANKADAAARVKEAAHQFDIRLAAGNKEYAKNAANASKKVASGFRNMINRNNNKMESFEEWLKNNGKTVFTARHSGMGGKILIHAGTDLPKDVVICHYGIKGQKRGIRRYQNEDGSYTMAGKYRYGIGVGGNTPSSHTTDQDKNKLIKQIPYKTGETSRVSWRGEQVLRDRRAKDSNELFEKYYNGTITDKDIDNFRNKWNFNITKDNIHEYAKAYGISTPSERASDLYKNQNSRKAAQEQAYQNTQKAKKMGHYNTVYDNAITRTRPSNTDNEQNSRKAAQEKSYQKNKSHEMFLEALRELNVNNEQNSRKAAQEQAYQNAQKAKAFPDINSKPKAAQIIKNAIGNNDNIPKTTLKEKKDSKKPDISDFQDLNRTLTRDLDRNIGRAMEQDLVKKHLNGTATDKDYENFIKRYAPDDGHTYTVDELKKLIDQNAGNGKTKTNSASKEKLNKPEKPSVPSSKVVTSPSNNLVDRINKKINGNSSDKNNMKPDANLNKTKPLITNNHGLSNLVKSANSDTSSSKAEQAINKSKNSSNTGSAENYNGISNRIAKKINGNNSDKNNIKPDANLNKTKPLFTNNHGLSNLVKSANSDTSSSKAEQALKKTPQPAKTSTSKQDIIDRISRAFDKEAVTKKKKKTEK